MTPKESRFDSLFSAVKNKQVVNESKHLDVQTSKNLDVQTSKSKNPDYMRTTVYLPKALHKRFKVAVMDEDRDMSEIVAELIDEWLSKHLNV